MEYGRIVKRAFNITWHHKALWVFGILAAFFGATWPGGRAPQYSFDGKDIQRWRQDWPLMPGAPFGRGGLPALGAPEWQTVGAIILGVLGVLIVVGLLMALVGIIVRNTSLGALIGMVDEIEEGEQTSFKAGLATGWKRFLRLFAISLIMAIGVALVVFVVILVLGIGMAVVAAPGAMLIAGRGGLAALGILWSVFAGLAALALVVLVFLALSALVTLVQEYAYRACVLDGMGVFDALSAGIALTRVRLRESVTMWLAMLGIRLALGLAAVPLIVLGFGAIVVPSALAAGATDSGWAALLIALPLAFLFFLAAAWVSGVYVTFRSAVWTLTFRELRPAEQEGV